MVDVIPAILVKSREEFESRIASIRPAAKTLHIDIMDGKFVPNATLQPKDMPPTGKFAVEYHLMVQNPLEYVKMIGRKDATYEIHVEALSDIDGAISQIRKMGAKIILAISPDTPAEKIMPYLKKIDGVLVMFVYPGFSGQKYISAMEEKVRAIRKAAPKLRIEIDGGVGLQNAKSAVGAGASVLNVASAIFAAKNPIAAIEEIKKEAGA
jgi:ribulose-phosphate 3-epimerase